MPKVVFLFDIDGVLVEPRGYRASVNAAVAHFLERMRLDGDAYLPVEDDLSVFEAVRITSEWDMVPLLLAALLDDLLERHPHLYLPATLEETCRYLSKESLQPRASKYDYTKFARTIGPNLLPEQFPSESVLHLLSQPAPSQATSHLPLILPRLAAFPGLAYDLLGRTRQVSRSATTRLFQHFSLGSRQFQETYQQPAEMDTPSLLLAYDRPLLSSSLRMALLEQRAAHGLAIAAFTMRPSLPPREIPPGMSGYAPEAELALDLVGFTSLPLIGYGRIRWLAEQAGVETESLLKPSPVQALAAILAAVSGDEQASLYQALTLDPAVHPSRMPGPARPSPAPLSLSIHVFEDTRGGIEAVQHAANLLGQVGWRTSVTAWGIAAHPEKAAALKQSGAQVFTRSEDAVRQALLSGT